MSLNQQRSGQSVRKDHLTYVEWRMEAAEAEASEASQIKELFPRNFVFAVWDL